MYLKRLEITGFKSFAKKTTLEFEKGITAIVGPNGSGKSNVADSIRWVLGEQSVKMIRGKKSDDVIFAGSDTKGRLGFAEVVATFDNRDSKIPLEAAEVSIGRRIDRSGDSEYLINGQKVRLMDIVELVLKSNIGTSRYTVIGQGTIDQLILAGPPAIKDLLDEASGVKSYFIKRERTLKRLETTAQNLMRAEDLVAEIEPRLKTLRRMAKKMEERGGIEQELKELQKHYYSAQYGVINAQMQGISAQLAEVIIQKTAKENLLNQLMNDTESKLSQSEQEQLVFDELNRSLNDLQTQKNKLYEHQSLLRGKIEGMKRTGSLDPESLKAHLHDATRKLEDEKHTLKSLSEQEIKAKQDLIEATQKLTQLNQALEVLYKQLSEPHEVDVMQIVDNLQSLEDDFGVFYDFVKNSSEIASVKLEAENFHKKFAHFKQLSNEIVTKPQVTLTKTKEELSRVLELKENTQKIAAGYSAEIARFSASIEYTKKQMSQLEMQKRQVELELSQATNTESDFIGEIEAKENQIKTELEAIEADAQKIRAKISELRQFQSEKRKEQAVIDHQVREQQNELSKLRDKENYFSVEKAKIETILNSLIDEVRQIFGEDWKTQVTLVEQSTQDPELVAKIARLKHQLDMIGGVDDQTVLEHKETEERFLNLSTQIEDLRKAMEDLREILEDLDKHIAKASSEAFTKINDQFEHYFRILFNGGRAYLTQVKSAEQLDAPLEDSEAEPKAVLREEEKIVQKYEHGSQNIIGIDIRATPPGKKLASIQALSGGERALTSIALLCSLLTCFPSPFVFLDEVDAALDEANTMRFGQILSSLETATQFVTVTHNRETMSQANTIYGVTMGDDGISRLLSIKFDQATVFAK